MPSFQEMFDKSRGKPIQYRGATLVLKDDFRLGLAGRLRLTFEKSESEWRQGVCLDANGTFLVNGQKIAKSIVLWRDRTLDVIEMDVESKDGIVEVWNAWDTGDGVTHDWHNGAAMIVEIIPTGRRYRCNDGHPDENFSDLIFRLELVQE